MGLGMVMAMAMRPTRPPGLGKEDQCALFAGWLSTEIFRRPRNLGRNLDLRFEEEGRGRPNEHA